MDGNEVLMLNCGNAGSYGSDATHVVSVTDVRSVGFGREHLECD